MITLLTVVTGILIFSLMILREEWKKLSRRVQGWVEKIVTVPKPTPPPWSYTTPGRLSRPPQGMGREGFYR